MLGEWERKKTSSQEWALLHLEKLGIGIVGVAYVKSGIILAFKST